MSLREVLSALGVPDDYGTDPELPRFADALELIDVEPNIVGRLQRLTPATAADWAAMKLAAAADGIELLLVSGFRSTAYQVELFRQKLAAGQLIEDILKVNAAPGHSQHHTGRAIDIATPGCRPLTDSFESTRAYVWLQKNAERFAFRMPYGRDNRYGIAYEPWHWSQLPD